MRRSLSRNFCNPSAICCIPIKRYLSRNSPSTMDKFTAIFLRLDNTLEVKDGVLRLAEFFLSGQTTPVLDLAEQLQH